MTKLSVNQDLNIFTRCFYVSSIVFSTSQYRYDISIFPGSSVKFTAMVEPAKNFPLDLYFVMDHSHSMKPTLDTLKNSVDAMSKKFRLRYLLQIPHTQIPIL